MTAYDPTPGWVVVRRHREDTQSKGGIQYTDQSNDAAFKRESDVVAVNVEDDKDLHFEIGDTVLIQRGTGMILDDDGLICVATSAVLCVVREDSADAERAA